MIKFDPNLILYHKIFQNEKIFNIYEKTKKFNIHLPNNWNQLDLFTWNIDGMAMLLGLEKVNIQIDEKESFNFKYYFLVEDENKVGILLKLKTFYTCIEKYKEINKEKIPIANKAWSLITATRIKSLKKEVIIKDDYTLKRFLNNFNKIDDWELEF